MKKSIGIIGLGFVGGTVFKWFKKKKHPLYCYDKYNLEEGLKETIKPRIF